MKKLVLALSAVNWTGFYVFGGAGGGLWDADTRIVDHATGAAILGLNQKQGGDGWFGTVGAGYDWQFSGSWVAGIFADGQFGSIKGTIQDQGPFIAGSEKLKTSWAAGVRLGYLVAPNVLSYVNGGYSGSNWSGTTLLDTGTGLPISPNWSMAPICPMAAILPLSHSCRPSAPRWSTASTGVARSLRSTDLC